MPDTIYYCTKENNDCPKRNDCERYLGSDLHTSKTTLFKNICTNTNNRILFIQKENINVTNNTEDSEYETKEDDSN